MANNVHAQATSTAVLDTPVIGAGHDFETVTETVAQIPLGIADAARLWVVGLPDRASRLLIGILQMALG